jgi:hypothetical protein
MALTRDVDALSFTIAAAGTTAAGQLLENPSEVGLIVPALAPNAAVKIQVSDDNATWVDVLDKTGAALLTIPATAGSYAVVGNALGAVLPYHYVRPVLSVATTAQVIVKIVRKVTKTTGR